MTETTFDSLDISAHTKRGIAEVLGYTNCSAVQQASLPPAIQGFDVLARAKTGTGKTLAFCIPAIEMLVRGAPSHMLVLCSAPDMLVLCSTLSCLLEQCVRPMHMWCLCPAPCTRLQGRLQHEGTSLCWPSRLHVSWLLKSQRKPKFF